jgi:hypothetical protein
MAILGLRQASLGSTATWLKTVLVVAHRVTNKLQPHELADPIHEIIEVKK